MAAAGRGKVVYRGRNVTVQFELDRAGIAKCAMGNPLRKAVTEVATSRALPYAISISPRSEADHKHYQDSFVVTQDTVTIRGLTRVAAVLFNTAPHAVEVEWGNRRIRHPHRVLGKTLDHLHGVELG